MRQALQAPADGPGLDAPQLGPLQPQQLRRSPDEAGAKQIAQRSNRAVNELGVPAGEPRFAGCHGGALNPRHIGVDEGCQLAGVQVPPLLGIIVGDRRLTLGADERLRSRIDSDGHSLAREVQSATWNHESLL